MVSSLAIVVVNYRSAELAVACLRSLVPEIAAHPGTRVVVVENGSGDDSAERLRAAVQEEGWGGWASVLVVADNRGFSAGNNAGIRKLLEEPEPPEWILLLNPDTVVKPGALRALLERGARSPRAGIVGAQLENPDGTLQASAFRFHSVLSELDGALCLGVVSRLLRRWALVPPHASGPAPVGWVSGAALMVRSDVLRKVGLLDEQYFLYYEEVDLCLRVARAGWERWVEPGSRIVHLNGASTGVDFQARRLPDYVFDSRRRYFTKNHGTAYAALVDLVWIAAHLAWRSRMWLQRRDPRLSPGFLRRFVARSVLVRGGER